MYNVEEASLVLAKLKSQINYETYVPDVTIKRKIEYKFFSRSVVDWKCTSEKL